MIDCLDAGYSMLVTRNFFTAEDAEDTESFLDRITGFCFCH